MVSDELSLLKATYVYGLLAISCPTIVNEILEANE